MKDFKWTTGLPEVADSDLFSFEFFQMFDLRLFKDGKVF